MDEMDMRDVRGGEAGFRRVVPGDLLLFRFAEGGWTVVEIREPEIPGWSLSASVIGVGDSREEAVLYVESLGRGFREIDFEPSVYELEKGGALVPLSDGSGDAGHENRGGKGSAG